MTDTPATSSSRTVAAARLLVVAAILAYAALCLRFDFLSDDAFITFRYARNLARGLGLVFNSGERVEGYTNFLLVVLLAPLSRAGADVVFAGRLLSGISGGACIALTWAATRRLEPARPLLASAAAGLVGLNAYLAAWGGSGLETTLFAALLLATALPLLGRPIDRRRFLISSGLGLLLALTRPEGVLAYAATAAWAAFAAGGPLRQRARALAPGLALFAALGSLYFLARWSYFGQALPNTFAAKADFGWMQARAGLGYLAHFLRVPSSLLLLAPACAGAVALRRRRQSLVPLLAGLLVAWVCGEGGDGLPMYRFMVPAIPLLALMAAAGVAWWMSHPRFARLGWLGIAWLLCGLALSPLPAHDVQLKRLEYQRDREIPQWSAAGRALGKLLPPGALVAAVPVGALGWYSDRRVLDMVGLTDRTIARAPADPAIAWAGHRKHDGPYVLSRSPEVILLGNIFVSDEPSLPEGPFPPFANPNIAARERDVADQPRFQQSYALATLPIGSGWYLHAFVRKDVLAASSRAVGPGP